MGEAAIMSVYVQFEDIDMMEAKRKQFSDEMVAIHMATVAEWDRLYGAIMEIAKKYKDSEALNDSKMKDLLPVKFSTICKCPRGSDGENENEKDGYCTKCGKATF